MKSFLNFVRSDLDLVAIIAIGVVSVVAGNIVIGAACGGYVVARFKDVIKEQ